MLMTVPVFVFAFSSVPANYAYAEINLFFLGVRERGIAVFQVLVPAATAVGAAAKLATVWDFADVSIGLMALVNLVAIVLLEKWAFAVLHDYGRQARQGRDPVFVAEDAQLSGCCRATSGAALQCFSDWPHNQAWTFYARRTRVSPTCRTIHSNRTTSTSLLPVCRRCACTTSTRGLVTACRSCCCTASRRGVTCTAR